MAQSLLVPRLETIDNFCPPDGLSCGYIILARQAREMGRLAEAESLLLHAEGLAAQRGWLRAQAPLLAERIAVALHAGDKLAADALLLPEALRDGNPLGHGNSVPRFHITWGTGPGVVAPFVRRVGQARERGLGGASPSINANVLVDSEFLSCIASSL